MPSTRRPPLKMRLPSMRVVAPIRLSMRFCGLLVLLNMVITPLSEGHQVGRAWLRRSAFVNPHLDALHFRLRAHPESPFDSLEVPESKLKSGCLGIGWLREAHDSTPPPFRQVDHQLQAPVEIAFPACARREQ